MYIIDSDLYVHDALISSSLHVFLTLHNLLPPLVLPPEFLEFLVQGSVLPGKGVLGGQLRFGCAGLEEKLILFFYIVL